MCRFWYILRLQVLQGGSSELEVQTDTVVDFELVCHRAVQVLLILGYATNLLYCHPMDLPFFVEGHADTVIGVVEVILMRLPARGAR